MSPLERMTTTWRRELAGERSSGPSQEGKMMLEDDVKILFRIVKI